LDDKGKIFGIGIESASALPKNLIILEIIPAFRCFCR
jgi:hypothetical protein